MGLRAYASRVQTGGSYFDAPPYLDIQKQIGKTLREQYEVPAELPHRLSTLLLEIDKLEDD